MADQPSPEGGEQWHQVQLEPGSQRGSPRQEALPAGGGRGGPSLCSVLHWAPQGKRGGAMLERTPSPGPLPLPVGVGLSVSWSQEPPAPAAWSCALGGGRVWPSSADQALATRFSSDQKVKIPQELWRFDVTVLNVWKWHGTWCSICRDL